MKEIITSVFLIIGLLGGSTMALKKLHDTVRTAALEKAVKGLPPLAPFTRALTTPPRQKKKKTKKRPHLERKMEPSEVKSGKY